MSNREKCIAILDSFTDIQLVEIAEMLRNALDEMSRDKMSRKEDAPADEPNEVTCAAIEAALNDEEMYGPFDSVEEMMEALDA